MNKDRLNFTLRLLGFTFLLCIIHYYIFFIFFSEITLYFPLWSIYLFNATLVFIVYSIIDYKISKGSTKTYNTFLMLTMGKMVLAIVFLIPLFAGKSANSKMEVINFFIPYFLFLAFEIMMLSKFLKNQ